MRTDKLLRMQVLGLLIYVLLGVGLIGFAIAILYLLSIGV